MSASCLVTDRIEFKEEKNLPPALLDTPSSKTPIGSMIWVNLSDFTGSGPKEVKFELQVSDENLNQKLKTRYDLSTLDLPHYTSKNIERDWGPEIGIQGTLLRPIELPIQTSLFSAGRCYRLVLVVSSDFKDLWDTPKTEGDIARAEWLIAVTSQSVTQVDINTCPSGEYSPQEYATSEVPDK